PIEVIPNGLDIQTYKPANQKFARKLLNLPEEKRIVLFGAPGGTQDRRKGFHLLQSALKKLSCSGKNSQIEMAIFGAPEPNEPSELGFKTHYIGRLQDDASLAALYSAADVMIVPSVQEAFGQTASESLACGTPVVAFDATGLRDIVDHGINGYLAEPYDSNGLAAGISWVLGDQERYQKLRQSARQKAEQEFSLDVQAKRYSSIFSTLVA
ncbi:MAG: glycosyltransferase, partial [Cyanothece sp. SIO1E1]|nr:glycosyltransferase [Cyanothece sp. SIO1E1]